VGGRFRGPASGHRVRSAGTRPDRGLEGISSDFFADTVVGSAFRQHSADPEAFAAYIEKMKVLGIEDQNISDAQMRSIQAKAMVIVGDADAVKPEHALAMFKLRGGGDEEAAATGAISAAPQARLVILPATSHISISEADPDRPRREQRSKRRPLCSSRLMPPRHRQGGHEVSGA
jgi:pimeloyl-ACP methyl ester carboxylesterase